MRCEAGRFVQLHSPALQRATCRRAFMLPLNVENAPESLRAGVSKRSSKAAVITAASLIVVDEFPMMHGTYTLLIDELMRDLTGDSRRFGGKVVITAGDFRQTCPVLRNGTRRRISEASILKAHKPVAT